MRELERRFPQEIAIVGVHSGKYHAERETPRIREAAVRLRNTHPIVNDRQFRVWRSHAVRAWPTLVIVDPTGHALGAHAGEFTAAALTPLIERMIGPYDSAGHLVRGELHVELDTPAIVPGVLRYPGKVVVDGDRIAIADSGHNRILIGRLTRDGRGVRIGRVIGGPESGLADGDSPRFHDPQGMALDGDRLFVADRGNHAIRAADLQTGVVATVAGTGGQLRTPEDLRAGALSSPWDVALADGTLYVAMAGIHQLWALDLAARVGSVHSGSKREDLMDGPHTDAALAQPMGIVADRDRLWFVDAESSAVRWAERHPSGIVGTVVGTGLFDFGDRDGMGDEALMQHPQGIARHPDGRLLIADTYNDALKWLDPATRHVTTWVRGLHEPGGVASSSRYAYVADTNAHRLVWVDYTSGEVGEVEIAEAGEALA
ncbi:MAG: alkyl hydroperoxide reductase [Gemmatimonadota bacterium]|nr:alkyl hydroperoxide reductase [Gemmatimonadota bacterium]